ncbi:MAG: hypothetical protein LBR51_05930 [Bacteroidales bacterium]|jgi:hypothetical protein|nr:hypothetical protein [Bacteroidales bacterium]
MSYFVTILVIFIIFATLFKLSFWKWWQVLLFGFLCAGFVVVSCRWSILQSKTQWVALFRQHTVIQNAVVWLTLESIAGFAFCFIRPSRPYKWVSKCLQWYPGLWIFPVLFYLQTQTIFTLSGSNFNLLSYGVAAVVLAAFPLLSMGLQRLCPAPQTREELYFMSLIFAIIIGLLATTNGTVSYRYVHTPVNIKILLISIAIFLLFFLAGVFWHRYRHK